MQKFPENDFDKETDEAIYFYTPRFYVFDNFSAYAVEIWGKRFMTSEHAYQWKKFSISNPAIADEIFNSPSPNQVKVISDSHSKEITQEFHDSRTEVMEEILRAKVAQHEKVKLMLKESGNKTIYENSPTDAFWGVGPDGNGENMLGKIWMKIRETL